MTLLNLNKCITISSDCRLIPLCIAILVSYQVALVYLVLLDAATGPLRGSTQAHFPPLIIVSTRPFLQQHGAASVLEKFLP